MLIKNVHIFFEPLNESYNIIQRSGLFVGDWIWMDGWLETSNKIFILALYFNSVKSQEKKG